MWLSYLFGILFGLFALLHIYGELLIIRIPGSSKKIRYFSKPFLMSLLAGFYLTTANLINWLILLGLIGGLIGDIMLMLPDKHGDKKYFRIGLIAFLMGHIFYIVGFLLSISSITDIPWWVILIVLQAIAYGIGIYRSLIPHTGEMKKPVSVYIIIIILMEISASCLFGSGTLTGVIILLIGVTLFMISDTINAFNRFKQPIPYERIITMSTYLLGQFLIILGLILAFK